MEPVGIDVAGNGRRVSRMHRAAVIAVAFLAFLTFGIGLAIPGDIGDEGDDSFQSIYCEDPLYHPRAFYSGALLSVILIMPMHRFLGARVCITFGALLFVAASFYSIRAHDEEPVYLRIISGVAAGALSNITFLFIGDSVPQNTFPRSIVYLNQIVRIGFVLVDSILLVPGGWRVIAHLQLITGLLLFLLNWTIASHIWTEEWSGNNLMIAHGNQQTAGGFFARRHRVQLIMIVIVPLFQQLTGIIVFSTRFHRAISGYRPAVALCIDIGCNIVSILATLASVYLVESRGITWRVLFTVGSLVMFISHLVISIIVRVLPFHRHMDTVVSISAAIFYAGFGLSWGPLALPISVEHLRLSPEIWTIGISCLLVMSSFSSIFVSFIASLFMCKYGPVMLYTALWGIMLLILAFSIFLIPSTVVGGEHLAHVIHEHFYWRRFHEE